MTTVYIWVIIASVPTFLAMPTNTVPALPTPTVPHTCKLDLSDGLFDGVKIACEGNNLDRSRCCPVLAAWMFATHARSVLTVVPETKFESSKDVPIKPDDDSQVCVRSLQDALQKRGINISKVNASCDLVLCFCEIRLHKISSLTCPAVFRLNSTSYTMTPTATVRDLEGKCVNSSNAGCTQCLGAHRRELPIYKFNHDLVRDVLFYILRCAGIAAKKEPPVNLLTYTREGRSTLSVTNILIFGWSREKHVCVDLTGVSPIVRVVSNIFSVGQVVVKAAKYKVAMHEGACMANRNAFISLAFDTFEFMVPEMVELLTRLQKVMHNNVMTPESMSVVLKHFSLLFRMVLQRSLYLTCPLFM